MGGTSSENIISIRSGKNVAAWLAPHFEVYGIIITATDWKCLTAAQLKEHNETLLIKGTIGENVDRNDFSCGSITFDVLYNMVHGTPGEDGKLPAYFEMLDIPLVGSNHYASAVTFNKRDSLTIATAAGIPTAPRVALNKGEDYELDQIVHTVGLPCFVKANRAGSSYGVSKVKQHSEFAAAFESAFTQDDELIIEGYLEGMEVSMGVLSLNGKITTLPGTEIVSENEFFDYEAKYNGLSQEITPARIMDREMERLGTLSRKLYKLFGLGGIARADFIYSDGQPYFLEMNSTPGMSQASIIPQQLQAAGMDVSETLAALVREKFQFLFSDS